MTNSAPELSTLARLAAAVGLQPSFNDARGQKVEASDEAIAAILDAIGLPAADDAEAARHLAALEQAEADRPLPPVIVERVHRLPRRVATPRQANGTPWRIEPEHGEDITGTVEDGAIELPAGLPPGYHRLVAGDARTVLILAPERCWLPHTLEKGGKAWGITTQLYLLRSAANWGIGDFSDLTRLVRLAAEREADVIGLNPLHALFLDDPRACSPYSPASRLWLNPLMIDIESVPELLADEEAQALIRSEPFRQHIVVAREADLVEYETVAALKLEALHCLHRNFATTAVEMRQHAFLRFKEEQGAPLSRFCLFQALRLVAAGLDPAAPDFTRTNVEAAPWSAWPEALQRHDSEEVLAFAREHEELIDFLAWLQWVADSQLAAASAVARDLKLEIGLYRDLAVGADAGGAETWLAPSIVVAGAHAGAPPDIFNPGGQDWGLPPFNPRALREEAYQSFIDLVRANMRHAGGLRIDHVLGLQRLWWVPAGRSPREGAYMAYPFEELAAILALESHRHECLVVGEDLGTVPEGFRERMADFGILSYKLLFFEQDEDGGFLPPSAYVRNALATVSSHDLPTLSGWWGARDVAIREERDLYEDPKEAARQRQQREQDRRRLMDALVDAGLWQRDATHSAGTDEPGWMEGEWAGGSAAGADLAPADEPPAGAGSVPPAIDQDALSLAVHRFLGRSGAAIAAIQIDELMREAEQVNLPATRDEYPNWRRRASMTLEELADDPRAAALMAAMAEARRS